MAARVLLGLLCLALQVGAVRHMWIDARVSDGQLLRARFEDPHGTPELALTGCCGEEFFPGPGIDAHGALAVSPGLIAVALLDRDETVVVTTDDATPMPYLVFGDRRSTDGTDWLENPRRVEPASTGVGLAAWDGGRPWRADAEWLATLGARCGGAARSVQVRTTGAGAEVRVGTCAPVTVPRREGEPLLMAVLAGPSWVTIARDPALHVDRRVSSGTLDPVLLFSIASVAGLAAIGPGALVAVSIGLLIASFVQPLAAWLALVGIALVAVLVAIVRLAVRIVPLRSRWMRVGVGYLGVAAALVAAVVGVQRAARGGFFERHWTDGGGGTGGRCQLVGYSPVANAQLRIEEGVSTMLAHCAACAGGLDVSARHGGRLDWTSKQVCTPEASAATRAVVAIGGNNDDMLWARGLGGLARHLVAAAPFVSSVYARTARPDYLLATLDAFAGSATVVADAQEAALRDATRCAHERGARFVFVHDLFIEDLAFGRSPVRQALLERRRAAVAPDGRERFFVDVREAFPEMGLFWFNDMRHPSLIGHRKIAERVCSILGATFP